MRISLDYDNTYTRDPKLWDLFIESAQKAGHEVLCITMRYPAEIAEIPCEVIYTSRQPKGNFMAAKGISVDIWIDDIPHLIFT